MRCIGHEYARSRDTKPWPKQMPNDRGKRSRVAKGEDFQVQHLAETTDLSPNQARELLRRYGDDWRKIDGEAR